MKPDEKVEAIFQLYEKYGEEDYIGEDVSQWQHAVQAAMLAEQEGFPPEIILGALFHDVGHLLGFANKEPRMKLDGLWLGTQNHEKVGETYLQGLGFPPAVTQFVRQHVDAKRYLVYKYKDYHDKLTPASQKTLILQGGPMSSEEAEQFQKTPHFQGILRMREWDERAKDPSVTLKPMQLYKDLCLNFLKNIESNP